MPGIGNSKFTPSGGGLPPLSREAEEAVEASWQRGSPAQRSSLSSPSSKHHRDKGFSVNQANIGASSPQGAGSDMQVAIRGSSEVALSFSNRKPKFLDDLENFLCRELQSLNVEDVESNESRLQAHREVFEYLIEDFKTYKPIFAAVKNEYEMMLQHQQSYIQQLEPLQQMLVTVTEQCDNEVMRLRDKEKGDKLQLRRQNERLQNIIDQIKNEQIALQIQMERLQQKLKDQYDRYRSEADARKLLVSDINDLRTQQEEMILQQQQASNRDESEDPVLIRQALKKARENEKEASLLLNDIIANYGDVIPKQDYLTLQTQYEELQKRVSEKTLEFDQLKEEQDSLLETHRQIISQRDEYYQESEHLRQTATPRPNWNRCGEVIAGGTLRWIEMAQGKSSDELVSVLLGELAGSNADNQIPDHFDSLGAGEDISFYLRAADGSKIKNRRLGRRDATILIKDVWREKDIYDSSQPPTAGRMPMSEYLIQYLNTKFPNSAEMVTEWAYNLDNACQRYGMHDEKIQLFYDVLNGQVDQELYFVQTQYLLQLLKVLTKENEGHEPADFFTGEEFSQILVTYFEGNGDLVKPDNIEKLIVAAQLELDDGAAEETTTDIEFPKLFFEDDEGKFGPFVDELKSIFTAVRLKYTADIMDALRKAELEEVAMDDLSRSIISADPELDPSVREAVLMWVYNVKTKAELDPANALPLETVEKRLNSKHIKRFF